MHMEKIKMLVSVMLVLVAVWFAYPYLTAEQAEFVKGSEVDAPTFNAILTNASNVYIVMDIRNAKDDATQQNILQCGVDFAGSYGLVSKNLTLYSFDTNQGCVNIERNYPVSHCLKQLENGIALYIEDGNETRFYSNGMRIGMGTSYALGSCSVNIK